jgi:cytochrome c-type biogenesis protein
MIATFGLHFLGVIRIPLLYREARLEARTETGTMFGAYVLGLAFAFGWTPCIGPVLGSILALAAADGSVGYGMTLMGFYALGLGVPFLLSGIFLRRALGLMGRLKRHMPTIERAMGVLLVGVGITLLTGWFTQFSFWLLETFPSLALIG